MVNSDPLLAGGWNAPTGAPPARLRTTNSIQSKISLPRTRSRNVKHWQGGHMALRWCVAGIAEAGKQFRRVDRQMRLPALRKTFNEHVAAKPSVPCVRMTT